MCAYRGTGISGWIEGIGPTRGLAGIAITEDEVVGLTARWQRCLILEERTCLVGTAIASAGNTSHGKGFVIHVHQGRGGSIAIDFSVCGLEGEGRGTASC